MHLKVYDLLDYRRTNLLKVYGHNSHKLLRVYPVGDNEWDRYACYNIVDWWIDYDERYGNGCAVSIREEQL